MNRTFDMKRVKGIINDGARYFFTGTDAVHALPLVGLVDPVVVTYESSPVTELLKARGLDVRLLKDDCRDYDSLKSTNNLISHGFMEKVTASFAGDKRLIVFKNSSTVEKRAKELGLSLLAPEAKTSRSIENKVKFYDELRDADIRLVPGETMTVSDDTEYAEITEKYGDTFVLQASKGFAGEKTYLVKNEDDFSRIKNTYNKRKMRLTKYLSGASVTINACATRLGTIVKPPFYQLTGISDLTVNGMGACGNDYNVRDIGRGVIEEIIGTTKKLGDIIYEKGFKGIFGVDYIVSGGRSYFIECNPRMVTSLPFFTGLELMRGEVPLLAFHILECTGNIEKTADIFDDCDVDIYGYSGAQVILHNLSDEQMRIKRELVSGVYIITGDELKLEREALSIDEIRNDDEYLIITKGAGTDVNPNMECARIMTRGKALLDDGGLDGNIRRVTETVYNRLF